MHTSSIDLRPEPAELRLLQRFVDRFCRKCGLGGTVRSRVQLVCEEWFINVVKHGFAGYEAAEAASDADGAADAAGAEDGAGTPRITVTLRFRPPDALIVRLRDNAPPFNMMDLAPPDLTLPAERRPIGGLGIHLIRRLSARRQYERVDGCNVLTLFMDAGDHNDQGEEPT